MHAAPPGLPGSPQSGSRRPADEIGPGYPTTEQVSSKQYGRIALAWYRRHVLGEKEALPEGVTSLVDYEAAKLEEEVRQEGQDYEPQPPYDDVEPPKPPAA